MEYRGHHALTAENLLPLLEAIRKQDDATRVMIAGHGKGLEI